MSLQEIFFSEIESLKSENQNFKLRHKSDQEKIKLYEEENERLQEMLNGLKRLKFGKKSERYESQEQMVFNEAEVLAKNVKPDLFDEIIIDPDSNAYGSWPEYLTSTSKSVPNAAAK